MLLYSKRHWGKRNHFINKDSIVVLVVGCLSIKTSSQNCHSLPTKLSFFASFSDTLIFSYSIEHLHESVCVLKIHIKRNAGNQLFFLALREEMALLQLAVLYSFFALCFHRWIKLETVKTRRTTCLDYATS